MTSNTSRAIARGFGNAMQRQQIRHGSFHGYLSKHRGHMNLSGLFKNNNATTPVTPIAETTTARAFTTPAAGTPGKPTVQRPTTGDWVSQNAKAHSHVFTNGKEACNASSVAGTVAGTVAFSTLFFGGYTAMMGGLLPTVHPDGSKSSASTKAVKQFWPKHPVAVVGEEAHLYDVICPKSGKPISVKAAGAEELMKTAC